MGVYGCLAAFVLIRRGLESPESKSVRYARRAVRGITENCRNPRTVTCIDRKKCPRREKADRWMMGRRKRVIRLKNVMEKSSGVVDLTPPSPSPSVVMTRPKDLLRISVLRSTLLVTFTECPRKSLSLISLSFIYGQGRTSSSVLDLISDYEHWTYVCGSFFFFGDGQVECGRGWSESLIFSTHIFDWWRPPHAQRLPDGDFTPPSFLRYFPSRLFSVSTSSVFYCPCMLFWHCRGRRHLSSPPSLFFTFF